LFRLEKDTTTTIHLWHHDKLISVAQEIHVATEHAVEPVAIAVMDRHIAALDAFRTAVHTPSVANLPKQTAHSVLSIPAAANMDS
jgi:hypothetical protein